MKKRFVILIICCVLAAALAGGLYYANTVLLPSVVRQKIVQGLSDLTSSKVTLDGLRLNLLKGLVLENLVVYDKTSPEKPLAAIKELSATFLIWPSLKGKKIVISSLALRQAVLSLRRQKDGTLNIAYLLDKLKLQDASASTPGVMIRQISFKEISVLWTDETMQPTAAVHVRFEEAQARLGFNRANLDVSGEFARENQTTRILINADYVFSAKSLSGRIVLRDLDISRYLDYLSGVPHAPAQGILDTLEADFTLQEQKTLSSRIQLHARNIAATYQDAAANDAEIDASFSFSVPTDNWSALQGRGHLDIIRAALRSKTPVEAQTLISDAHADIACDKAVISIVSDLVIKDLRAKKEDIKATGINAYVHAQALIPRPGTAQEQNQPKYKGNLDITSGDLDGLPLIEKAKIFSAQASFDQTNISLTRASAELLGTTITASGTLKDNTLHLRATGSIRLARLLPLIKKQYGWPIRELSGEADANIRITTDLAQKKTSLEAEALLREPALTINEPAFRLEASSGRVSFNTQKEKAAWRLEGVSLFERTFVVDATLTGFKTPVCDVKAIARDMTLEARLNKTDNTLDIPSFKAGVKKSRLEGSGQYDLTTAALHLNAAGDINIPDLKEWASDKAVFEKPLDLNGLCRIRIDATGPAKDWTSWKINSNVTSQALRMKGFTIKDVTLNYTQTAGQGFINFLNFTAYNGPGVVRGRLDLRAKESRYTLTGEIKGLDLALLKNDIPDIKDKAFYGSLNIQAIAEGNGADTKSISGQGQLVITNGNIWDFNPLRGLGDFIFIPRFNTLSFSHATGDFLIKEGWLTTDNLELMGQNVEILIRGRIGFDGTLELLAATQIPTTGPGQSPIGDVITQAGGMTAIKITGTIEKPQYKLHLTQNIFKKLGDFLSSLAP